VLSRSNNVFCDYVDVDIVAKRQAPHPEELLATRISCNWIAADVVGIAKRV